MPMHTHATVEAVDDDDYDDDEPNTDVQSNKDVDVNDPPSQLTPEEKTVGHTEDPFPSTDAAGMLFK